MFFLFAGFQYYPESGVGDYKETYPTQEEATAAGKAFITGGKYDWYSVLAVRAGGHLDEVDSGFSPR